MECCKGILELCSQREPLTQPNGHVSSPSLSLTIALQTRTLEESWGPYVLFDTITLVVVAALPSLAAHVRAGRKGAAVREEILARLNAEAAGQMAAQDDQQGAPATVAPYSGT
jgi:hypothetical protein